MKMSEKLLLLRENKGMTQQELSEAFGISRNALCGYELAERMPNVIVLKKYTDYFKVSADWLLGRDTSEDVIPCDLVSLQEKKRLKKIAKLKQELAELEVQS